MGLASSALYYQFSLRNSLFCAERFSSSFALDEATTFYKYTSPLWPIRMKRFGANIVLAAKTKKKKGWRLMPPSTSTASPAERKCKPGENANEKRVRQSESTGTSNSYNSVYSPFDFARRWNSTRDRKVRRPTAIVKYVTSFDLYSAAFLRFFSALPLAAADHEKIWHDSLSRRK